MYFYMEKPYTQVKHRYRKCVSL